MFIQTIAKWVQTLASVNLPSKIAKNSDTPEPGVIEHHPVNSRPLLSCHIARIWPLREVRKTAGLRSLRLESWREKRFENFSVFPMHVLSSASGFILTARTSEPMFWFVHLIPLFAGKSFLQRANGMVLAVRGHLGPLCCGCLPYLPFASCVTKASSLTGLSVYHYKIYSGNGMPLLSSCEVEWQVPLNDQRSGPR